MKNTCFIVVSLKSYSIASFLLTVDKLNSIRNNTLHLLRNVSDESSVDRLIDAFFELVVHSVNAKKSVTCIRDFKNKCENSFVSTITK
jgi:hypothetical protein